MADLVEAGKIRSVGVSNLGVERMWRAHAALEKRGLPLAANQVHYSLLQRGIESNGVLDAARDLGITIIAWQPLGAGILTGKFHKDPDRLKQAPFVRRMMLQRELERSQPLIEVLDQIAAEYKVTLAQIALNWLVNFQGETVVAIPGASKAQQARESAGAMAFRLSDEEMARIDEVSRAL